MVLGVQRGRVDSEIAVESLAANGEFCNGFSADVITFAGESFRALDFGLRKQEYLIVL